MMPWPIAAVFITALTTFSGFANASQAGASAFSRLRAQFMRAETPMLSDYQMGRDWHCSASLEAAKGQMRYVSLWEHRYSWVAGESSEELFNDHEYFEFSLVVADSMTSRVDLFGDEVFEFYRVNEDGHLLVEVAKQGHRRMSVSEKSVTDESLKVTEYYLCQNPEWHSSEDWDYEKEQIFSGSELIDLLWNWRE